MVALMGRAMSMANTMVFRSELQPMTPERFLGTDSSSSSRQRDLVFVVNPLGLLFPNDSLFPIYLTELNDGVSEL